MERIDTPSVIAYRGRKGTPASAYVQQVEMQNDGVTNTLTSVCKDNLLCVPRVLRMERTEEEKARRSQQGESGAKFSAAKQWMPRPDDVTNTLSTNTKDNMLIEPKILSVLEQAKQLSQGKRGGTGTAVLEENGNIRSCYYDEKGKNHSISEGVFCHTDNPSATVTTMGHNACYGKPTLYRIRRLTPRECFRLMDVDDTDIDKIQQSGVSETQQYKLAGNSIVVSCLYHIFRKMFIETENENQQLTLF